MNHVPLYQRLNALEAPMKKHILSRFISIGLLSFGSLAVAADNVSNNEMKGNIEAGKGKSAMCAGCHGADGNSAAGTFPKLAGQNERYLVKQLQDVKSGVRSIPMMMAMAAQLSDQDMADIAAFYASQTSTIGAANKDLVELGEKLYRAGNKETKIPACSSCHSPTGKGNGPAGFPALQGQHAEYTEKQLKDFRKGERKNDGESQVMRTISYRLKDEEIKAVSSYIQGLHD